jgi:cytochrome c oxidase subunit 2
MTRLRSDQRNPTRLAFWLLGLIFVTLFSGCKLAEVFALHGPQSTYLTGGPVAKSQWDLFMVTVYVTAGIFVVVGAVLAYATVKFRARTEGDEHAAPPPQGHGNPFVEMGLIVGSVVLLVIIAIPTLKGIWYTHDVPEAEKGEAMEVVATGYQWWFKFEYPSERVALPAGGDAPLSTANELVVPAGVPVRVQLRTMDVIHSFWVPKLAGKVDMIPNRGNFLWFKADKPGYFYGQCAEYCGDSHAIMRFRVVALSPSQYVKWLDAQKQNARTATAGAISADGAQTQVKFASMQMPAVGPGSTLAGDATFDADPLAAWQAKQAPAANEEPALIAQGHELFGAKTCMNCHTIRGHSSKSGSPYGGITAPELTHVGSRSSIAAGVLENSPERMSQWLHDPEYFKPGNKMVHGIGGMAGYYKLEDGKIMVENGKPVRNIMLSDDEITALVAYLQSLK